MAKGEITLIIGGARSGKSSLAEKLAGAANGAVVYVATAGVHDDEMAERVRQHRLRRPDKWRTVEETHRLPGVLLTLPRGAVVLIDCLTLWMSNLLLDDAKEDYIIDQARGIVQVARNRQLHLIMVSNEVGCGLVPEYELGRVYRDVAGRVNQLLAELSDRVIFVVAGLPLELKTPAGGSGTKGI
ncbi:Bifunctional adenosylcobalamin biosynthesis protein CobP [Sporotomaculum syntrophicum]|uniref:Adenosylcobinamide kinase n=1 Tax=Sporotomaculum syntrophicum TaxID=182264 RepID=A0A9D2WQ86_9FIRM|nr:bifunctional adenosylcobinamide kinase/adenosylcobinamide-phosphate guanylyltransferase [Sporotomaculum syntrophicum]KAF1085098.1 Bifunctional adenosylcobalamin biosynthesis protein CobP [Sporotomaculum syntrophicum]